MLVSQKHGTLGGPDGPNYYGDPSRVDDRDWYAIYNEMITQLTLDMIDELMVNEPNRTFKFRKSFMSSMMFFRTTAKYYFLYPLLAFLLLFPWGNYFISDPQTAQLFSTITLWTYVGILIGTALYFVLNLYMAIKKNT